MKTSEKAVCHSLVVPIHNEEKGIAELYRRVIAELAVALEHEGEALELILVDDGSTDESYKILKEIQKNDPSRVKLIRLSRNFGHQVAITAGLDFATGDTVSVIDADLQDPPIVILEMIKKWREGFDVVYGKRVKRMNETFFKRWTAAFFYRLLNASTKLYIPQDTGDFRLLSRRAADALKTLKEQHRFVRGLAAWVGFRQTFVPYIREARFDGETKYTLRKMIRLAWDAFSGFSLLPLRVATYLGLCISIFSVALSVWTLYQKLIVGQTVVGWSSLMITILLLGGVQLFSIGILGEYIGRIFEETKKRPLYLISEYVATEVITHQQDLK